MPAQKAALVWLALLLSACASPGSELPPLPSASTEPYQLGSGDRIRVDVFGFEDLSNEYIVTPSGTVSMPLIGSVPAQDRTMEELEQAITGKLAEGVIRDPSVSVELVQPRPFFVLGEVRNPGQFAFVPGMTALTAVAIAGGYTFRAAKGRMAVTRMIDGLPVQGAATPTTQIRPGDTVLVYERWF